MTRYSSSIANKVGLPPGTLVHVGDVSGISTSITLIDYTKDQLIEKQIGSIDEILEYKETDTVTWVIIEGLSNTDIIKDIGRHFGIHQLVLEDILNTHQRPKFEEYEDYLYIVLKSLLPVENKHFSVDYEQISILVLENFVFTFKEKNDDLFDSVRERLITSKGRFRNLGSDYLTYVLLDTIIDNCFVLIDTLDDSVSLLEDQMLSHDATDESLHTIQRLKREIIIIRRYISPIRELMSGILRSESVLIPEKTHIYLRDVYDHSIRVIESIETYREILSGLLEIYISSVSNKMNEVMKVLTVFASIFIPLTFLTGIYGMNFEFMPELKWKWAYPVLWVAFITIPAVLIYYFKRKKWL
jgi:magnesium transporter